MLKFVLYILIILFSPFVLIAQKGTILLETTKITKAELSGVSGNYIIKVDSLPSFLRWLAQSEHHIKPSKTYPEYNVCELKLTPNDYASIKQQYSGIQYADVRFSSPQVEAPQTRYDQTLNRINTIPYEFPNLTGSSEMLAIKEPLFDTTDIDLIGRFISYGLETAGRNQHATDMATLSAGSGVSFYTGRGIAPEALITSSDFNRLFPDTISFFIDLDIQVQNHSYGIGIENYYGLEARAYDEQIYQLPSLTHIFSSGNQGVMASDSGPYQGIAGYANLTGTFKQAKNIITVGAVDSSGMVESMSSKGPAFDGRIKPELAAFGVDGSSGAAALTSGVTLLAHQIYRQQNGQPMPVALLKGFLLNSAQDVGLPGPNFSTGYGLLDAKNTLDRIQKNQFVPGIISPGHNQTIPLLIPERVSKLKVMLSWTDPPGPLLHNKTLINDLDISLTNLETGETYLPFVKSGHPDSLLFPAQRKKDSLNPQEQIIWDFPKAGNYQIMIQASPNNNEKPQEYFITYDWKMDNALEWEYPLRNDPVRAGQNGFIRWTYSGLTQQMGSLQFKWVNDTSWQTLRSSIPLVDNQSPWNIPNAYGLAQLRLITDSLTVVSDTFLISKPIDFAVEYLCDDELLLTWESIQDATNYNVIKILNDGTITTEQTQDTFFIFTDIKEISQTFLAVQPTFKTYGNGIQSLAKNIGFQQPTCYISSFSGNPEDNKIALELTLSSELNISNILVNKILNEQTQVIDIVNADGSLKYLFTDLQPLPGVNTYQVELIFSDGKAPISNSTSVSYLGDSPIVLYNNMTSEAGLSIQLQPNLVGSIFEIYDMAGRLVNKVDLLSTFESVYTSNLPAGAYLYKVLFENKTQSEGTFILFR